VLRRRQSTVVSEKVASKNARPAPGVFVSADSQPYGAVMPFVLGSCKVNLGIRASATGLCCIDFRPPQEPLLTPCDALTKRVIAQLQDYLSNPLRGFDLPLDLAGTPFQRRAWEELCRIPAGHPVSYGELARRLGSGARAVGNACRRNPIPIVAPCHRVVSSRGLGGYGGAVAGEQLHFKQALLEHEARCAR